MPTIKTLPHILALLHSYHTLRPVQIHKMTGISRQQIHNVLRSLLQQNKIIRRGKAPLSYYSLKTAEVKNNDTILDISPQQAEQLDKDFVIIKREGRQVHGARAVCDYAQEHNVDPQSVAEQFLKERSALSHSLSTADSGAADQIELLETKTEVEEGVISRYNFADFVSAGNFGMTATAKKLRAAKASDDGVLQMELFQSIEKQVHEYIMDYAIDAVAFMPGSSAWGKRFMTRWKEHLDLPLPHVDLVRAVTDVSTPQDAISLREDRAEHADCTLIVADHRRFEHVLILDDELLTGRSMMHASRRILDAEVSERVSAYTITYEHRSEDNPVPN